ncbi:MAG: hypothetical protein OXC09_05825 [Truepera sp.]|nr:hypothetical protein [Truepera sp.]
MIDTLTIARDLEASGIDRKQAEAIAAAIGKSEERTATKGDIAALRSEVRFLFGFLFLLNLAIMGKVFEVF